MNIVELAGSKFVVTSEICPPKGIDVSGMLEDAELLREKVDAINVTDQQSSVMRLGAIAVSHILKEKGLEPICQITCRDRNRIALQSDLLSAAALGAENILCLTGDYVSLGDHPDAMPVFELDSVSLLIAARTLREGYDMAGGELSGSPKFCLGAVVTPCADPLEPQLIKMEKKIASGAQFFQTQAVYDPKVFACFMEQTKGFNVPVLVGIIPLKSAKMARYMNKNVAGINIPRALITEMENAEDKAAKGIEIAARLIKEMKPLCQGVHIMPIGWEKNVPKILDEAGL